MNQNQLATHEQERYRHMIAFINNPLQDPGIKLYYIEYFFQDFMQVSPVDQLMRFAAMVPGLKVGLFKEELTDP